MSNSRLNTIHKTNPSAAAIYTIAVVVMMVNAGITVYLSFTATEWGPYVLALVILLLVVPYLVYKLRPNSDFSKVLRAEPFKI